MRQSCRRIGMAIFTALSPQVVTRPPAGWLAGRSPGCAAFRCSSRERDMSMANITRRKKGFQPREEGWKGGGTGSTPLSLSLSNRYGTPYTPTDRGSKVVKMRRNGRVLKLAAGSLTRISPARISPAGVVNLGGDRPIYEVLLMPGTRSPHSLSREGRDHSLWPRRSTELPRLRESPQGGHKATHATLEKNSLQREEKVSRPADRQQGGFSTRHKIARRPLSERESDAPISPLLLSPDAFLVRYPFQLFAFHRAPGRYAILCPGRDTWRIIIRSRSPTQAGRQSLFLRKIRLGLTVVVLDRTQSRIAGGMGRGKRQPAGRGSLFAAGLRRILRSGGATLNFPNDGQTDVRGWGYGAE